eukprot:scaffold368_cov258-Pinguiococcus_pyrenoidosus.AAC.7
MRRSAVPRQEAPRGSIDSKDVGGVIGRGLRQRGRPFHGAAKVKNVLLDEHHHSYGEEPKVEEDQRDIHHAILAQRVEPGALPKREAFRPNENDEHQEAGERRPGADGRRAAPASSLIDPSQRMGACRIARHRVPGPDLLTRGGDAAGAPELDEQLSKGKLVGSGSVESRFDCHGTSALVQPFGRLQIYEQIRRFAENRGKQNGKRRFRIRGIVPHWREPHDVVLVQKRGLRPLCRRPHALVVAGRLGGA